MMLTFRNVVFLTWTTRLTCTPGRKKPQRLLATAGAVRGRPGGEAQVSDVAELRGSWCHWQRRVLGRRALCGAGGSVVP